jgi:hypothetical protein
MDPPMQMIELERVESLMSRVEHGFDPLMIPSDLST